MNGCEGVGSGVVCQGVNAFGPAEPSLDFQKENHLELCGRLGIVVMEEMDTTDATVRADGSGHRLLKLWGILVRREVQHVVVCDWPRLGVTQSW